MIMMVLIDHFIVISQVWMSQWPCSTGDPIQYLLSGEISKKGPCFRPFLSRVCLSLLGPGLLPFWKEQEHSEVLVFLGCHNTRPQTALFK